MRQLLRWVLIILPQFAGLGLWSEQKISFGFFGVVLVINPAGQIQIESLIALLATLAPQHVIPELVHRA